MELNQSDIHPRADDFYKWNLTSPFASTYATFNVSNFRLVGFLYDLTGSYDMTFYFFGIVIALSGLMCLPVNAVMRWERRQMDRSDVEMANGPKSK